MPESFSSVKSIPRELWEQVQLLYDRGLYLRAYQVATSYCPLEQWRAPEDRLLAARLAIRLGSFNRSVVWLRDLVRRNPVYLPALPYWANYLLHRFGPWHTWRWMEQREPLLIHADDLTRGLWVLERASVMTRVRDFARAEEYLSEARPFCADDVWIGRVEVELLAAADRYADALAAGRRWLTRYPHQPTLVQSVAETLVYLQRDDEAWQLLHEADRHVEAFHLVIERAQIELEKNWWERLEQSLCRAEELGVLMGKRERAILALVRFELAYHRGDLAEARRWLQSATGRYAEHCLQRLSDNSYATAKRVELPVGYVRQHHVTCGPATLAALSAYWHMPVDQLKIAEQICYDGTSHYNERRWAECHGWYVREFSVTEKAAEQLIERGIPFTVTTYLPFGAHLQAVIGYDGRLGTLQVRDPYYRPTGDVMSEKFIEYYSAYGPRGMALVPMEERHRLEDLALPDAAIWDLIYAVAGALERHDRQEAQMHLAKLEAIAPDHRLTRFCRVHVAQYDGNPLKALADLEALANQFQENPTTRVRWYEVLIPITPVGKRISLLRQWAGGKHSDAVYWLLLATELVSDARQIEEAGWCLRRAARRMNTHARLYCVLGQWYEAQRQFADALEMYRWAACLEDKNEEYVQRYFETARAVKRTDEAIRFLEDRCTRYGHRSPEPVKTLAVAYSVLGRTSDAQQCLQRALELRPDDGDLLLWTARFYLGWGLVFRDQIDTLLRHAEGRVPPNQYRELLAMLAEEDGQFEEALEHHRELLRQQPLSIESQRAVVRLIATLHGPEQARAELEELVRQWPHYQPLQNLWLSWTAKYPPREREPTIRWLLSCDPENPSLMLALADCCADQQRWDEAAELADSLMQRAPWMPRLFLLCYLICRARGDMPAARQILRDAVVQGIATEEIIDALIVSHDGLDERKRELSFVLEQWRRLVVTHEQVGAYLKWAEQLLPRDDYYDQLREVLAARPDFIHVGYHLARHLIDQKQLDEAQNFIDTVVEQSPAIAPFWHLRAYLAQVRGDEQRVEEALRTAYRWSPRYVPALMDLCEWLEAHGQADEAYQLMQQAAARAPLDSDVQRAWARTLERRAQYADALRVMRRVVHYDPTDRDAWQMLIELSAKQGQQDELTEIARQLTRQRPGDPHAWLTLAEVLPIPAYLPERLQAIERALQLDSKLIAAHVQRVTTFGLLQHWEEALEACRPAIFQGEFPDELQRYEIFVLRELKRWKEALQTARQRTTKLPQHPDSWYLLAETALMAEKFDQALAAAQYLLTLRPWETMALSLLADIHRARGQREEAHRLYKKAAQLAPSNYKAILCRVAMYLEEGRLSEADELLSLASSFDGSGQSQYWRIRWASAAHQPTVAIREFERLLLNAQAESQWRNAALEAICDAGWMVPASELLDILVEKPDIPDWLGHYWLITKLRSMARDIEQRAVQLLNQGAPAARTILISYVQELANHKHLRRLSRFLQRYKRSLMQTTLGWAVLTYAYLSAFGTHRAYYFAQQWSRYSNLEPWMLHNVVVCLLSYGRFSQATSVSQFALHLTPDETSIFHRHVVALSLLWENRLSEAQAHLAGAIPLGDDSVGQFLATVINLMTGILAVRNPEEKEPQLRSAWLTLKTLTGRYPCGFRGLPYRHVLRRTLRWLKHHDPTWWQRLSYWHLYLVTL